MGTRGSAYGAHESLDRPRHVERRVRPGFHRQAEGCGREFSQSVEKIVGRVADPPGRCTPRRPKICFHRVQPCLGSSSATSMIAGNEIISQMTRMTSWTLCHRAHMRGTLAYLKVALFDHALID